MADEQGTNVVQSVISHASQLATLQERQRVHEEDVTQELEQMRTDLYDAIEESVQGYTKLMNDALARVDQLEEQVAGKAQKAPAPAKPEVSNEKNTAPAPAPGNKPNVKVEEPEPAFRLVRRNGRKIKRAVAS